MQKRAAAETGCSQTRRETIGFRPATVFGSSPRTRLDLLANEFIHRTVSDRVVVPFERHFKRNDIGVRDIARIFENGLAK
jgi:nucleoside-diphosphate-sugar epimerase